MAFGQSGVDGSSGDENGEIQRDLFDRFRERGTRFGFAAAAAIGTAGTRLQLGEAAHTIRGGAANVVIGNGVAETDVHGAHFNANANDCQL